MEDYKVIKELPDARVGVDVIWDEEKNCFFYEKSMHVTPFNKSYLTRGQVTQTPEYFCTAKEYPECYAFNYPVFSRKDILDIIKQSFPEKIMDGHFKISASSQLHNFEVLLRDIGFNNAKDILKNQ